MDLVTTELTGFDTETHCTRVLYSAHCFLCRDPKGQDDQRWAVVCIAAADTAHICVDNYETDSPAYTSPVKISTNGGQLYNNKVVQFVGEYSANCP